MKSKDVTILSIETSCDDTGIAIVKTGLKSSGFETLSNIVSSQVRLHAKYGGVYPALAQREHQKNLIPVLKTAIKEAKLSNTENNNPKIETIKEILKREPELLEQFLVFVKNNQKPNIDLIAITTGPGLEPCLWVGVNFARALAFYWNLPVVSVNHIKAHVFVSTLQDGKIKELTKKDFPALCLIVSGGHTLLFLMKGFGKYQTLGETRDDAAGECFDKTARILGLGYPGGPEIAKMAELFKGKSSIKLPRPMINTKDYDFSFSGLKTAVLYSHLKKKGDIKEMCSEIQQSIIDVLIKKTLKAARDYRVKTIILGGGVVANKELRKQFKEKLSLIAKLFLPDVQNCTDNALMVALTAYFRYRNGKTENWKKIRVDANLKID